MDGRQQRRNNNECEQGKARARSEAGRLGSLASGSLREAERGPSLFQVGCSSSPACESGNGIFDLVHVLLPMSRAVDRV